MRVKYMINLEIKTNFLRNVENIYQIVWKCQKYCVDILRNYSFFEIDKDDFVVAYILGATEVCKVRVCERVPVRVPARVPKHIIEDTDNIIIKEGREENTTTTTADPDEAKPKVSATPRPEWS